MTPVALMLIVAGATCHATWNLLLKRSGSGGPAFVWIFLALSSLLYTPVAVAVIAYEHPGIDWSGLVFMFGSGILHLGYFVLLQRGYRAGDLSVIYPLARGTGPALSTAVAVAFLGERPSVLALAGGAVVIIGVVTLSLSPSHLDGEYTPHRPGRNRARLGIAYALLTGCFIAAYTLWDKHAVTDLAIPPLLLNWGSNIVLTSILGLIIARRWDEVRAAWRRWRRDAIAIAVLSPLAYILVLTALKSTPVSYVAPAREISIAIGALIGILILHEGDASRRLLGASLILVGVVGLALG